MSHLEDLRRILGGEGGAGWIFEGVEGEAGEEIATWKDVCPARKLLSIWWLELMFVGWKR